MVGVSSTYINFYDTWKCNIILKIYIYYLLHTHMHFAISFTLSFCVGRASGFFGQRFTLWLFPLFCFSPRFFYHNCFVMSSHHYCTVLPSSQCCMDIHIHDAFTNLERVWSAGSITVRIVETLRTTFALSWMQQSSWFDHVCPELVRIYYCLLIYGSK